MKYILLFVAALAFEPLSAHTGQEPAEISASNVEADLVAYGEWMARVQQIEAPLHTALNGIHPAWQEAQTGGGGFVAATQRMTPTINRTLASIDAATAQLRALDTPQFPALDLPEDATTSSVREQMLQVSQEMRTVVEGFVPLLQAVEHGNARDAERAGNGLLQSLALVFRSQIVMTRASLATTPTEAAAWHMVRFQLGYFQTGERVLRAFRPFNPTFVDADLAADMTRLADQLEEDARKGEQKVENEIAQLRELLSETELDSTEAAPLRRLISVLTIDRGYFVLSRELAAILRAEAPQVRGRAFTQAGLMRVFLPMRQLKERWMEITRLETAALTESN